MFRTFSVSLFVFSLLLAVAPLLRAQKPGTGGHAGGVIDVQVRYANGQPGPRDVHVRLEAAEGGPAGDCETREGGKCQFSLSASGVYTVRVAELGFQEVSARVELIGSSRGYAVLELKPLPGQPKPATSGIEKETSVSVSSVNIPLKAQQEFDKGEAALKANQAEESAKHFEKAVKLYDNYPQAYRMLGEAYLEQQDWQKAEAALKKSIELEPKLAASYVDLGAIANQQHNYPAAEESLKKGLELSPEASAAKYELAKTYWATGRWQDAEPLARDVVKAQPDLAGAHVLLANILLKKRDAAGALHEYEEYLRQEPNGSMAPQVRDVVAKIKANLPK